MPRSRTSLAVLIALVLGAAVVLVAWLVLLLQADGGPSFDDEIHLARPTVEGQAAPMDDLHPLPPSPEKAATRQVLKPKEPERSGPLSVLGRVVDRATGQPVASFQVAVLPHAEGSPIDRLSEDGVVSTPYHRVSGAFDFPMPAGRYDVVVRAPGYLPATLSDVVLPATDHRPVVIQVDRGDGISGLAVDRTDGLPLADIKVFLAVQRLDDPEAEPPRIMLATTGLDGRFSFSPLPGGEYSVSLLEPDNEVDRVGAIRIFEGRGPVDVTIWMQPRHQVQLKIQDPRGRPVSGVRVDLRSESHFATGSSNSQGIVVLDHVPDGTFNAHASRRGYRDLDQPIELYGGEGYSVQWLTLEPLEEH